MIYRISMFANVALSFLFIGLGIIATFNDKSVSSASVFVLLFILFGYGIFLCFDFIYYHILKLNKEQLPLTGWIKNYGKIIFVLSILALLSVLFITIGASYAFFLNSNSFPERQRPFFISFLILLLLSAVTYIFTVVGYFKSLKENKSILNDHINDIGASP